MNNNNTEPSSSQDSDSVWNSVEPLLRLFHALVHDDILPEYIETQYALPEEDSFEHQLEIWSKITDLFNDPSFLPKSYYLPSLHKDFTGETELKPLQEPQKIRDLFMRFTICKKQMRSLRLYIFDDTQYQFSKIKPTIVSLLRQATNTEKLSALYTFPSTLMYLWHLDDAFQWLTPLEVRTSDAILGEGSDGKYASGLPAFARRRKAYPGLMETQMTKIADPWLKLQSAEKHHSEMTKKYADMLTKLSSIGGKNQDIMMNMVEDILSRINASYDRCVALETNIVSEQRDFE